MRKFETYSLIIKNIRKKAASAEHQSFCDELWRHVCREIIDTDCVLRDLMPAVNTISQYQAFTYITAREDIKGIILATTAGMSVHTEISRDVLDKVDFIIRLRVQLQQGLLPDFWFEMFESYTKAISLDYYRERLVQINDSGLALPEKGLKASHGGVIDAYRTGIMSLSVISSIAEMKDDEKLAVAANVLLYCPKAKNVESLAHISLARNNLFNLLTDVKPSDVSLASTIPVEAEYSEQDELTRAATFKNNLLKPRSMQERGTQTAYDVRTADTLGVLKEALSDSPDEVELDCTFIGGDFFDDLSDSVFHPPVADKLISLDKNHMSNTLEGVFTCSKLRELFSVRVGTIHTLTASLALHTGMGTAAERTMEFDIASLGIKGHHEITFEVNVGRKFTRGSNVIVELTVNFEDKKYLLRNANPFKVGSHTPQTVTVTEIN